MARRARPAMLEGGMTEAIIGGALVAVLEHLIGFVDLLEPVLGVLVAGIAVGVPLHGELAKRALELRAVGAALDFQNLVVAAFAHADFPRSRHLSQNLAQRAACVKT